MTLPLVPTPATGESLRSYVARLETANHQRRDTLIDLADNGAATDWRRLADLTGISPTELKSLGWDGYPGAILGTRGSTGWRLRQARWWCPQCLETSRIWQRAWELACLPVCLICGQTLVSAAALTTPGTDHDVGPFLRIARWVERSPQHAGSRIHLGRLLRVTRLLAATADHRWPTPLPKERAEELNSWGHHPPDAPAAIAAILPYVQRLVEGREERPVVAQAWTRLDLSEHPIAHTLLPKRPSTPQTRRRRQPVDHRAPSPHVAESDLDRQRCRDMLNELDGFPTHLVPALAPSAAHEFLPAPEAWPKAEETAIALTMLANPRRGGKPGWASQAQIDLGLSIAHPSPILALLQEGHLLPDLEARVQQLMEKALALAIDFRARRRILTRLRQAPRFHSGVLSRPVGLGWLWVYLTHGRIVPTGPSWIPLDHAMPTLAVIEAHTTMNLEQRLQLAEGADHLWAFLSSTDIETPAAAHQSSHSNAQSS